MKKKEPLAATFGNQNSQIQGNATRCLFTMSCVIGFCTTEDLECRVASTNIFILKKCFEHQVAHRGLNRQPFHIFK